MVQPPHLEGSAMTLILGRRTLLKAMGGAAGAAMLGACNESRVRSTGPRPTVRVKSWTSLGYPGPYTYTGNPGYWRMSLLFDTLLWPDSTGTQLPWLAKSHTASEDGMTHTLELRDARFADGRPVRAQDVKFTYDYYTDEARVWTPLLIAVPRAGIDVRVLSERTVEFRLDRPDPLFVQQVLGSMPVTPEHVFSQISDPMGTQENKVLNGCGAYKLVARSLTQDFEAYEAKDDYYLGRPFVKRIEMVTTTDDNDLNAIKIGALDAGSSPAEGVRNEAIKPFLDDPQYGVVTREAGFGFPMFFNMAKGGALADVRFRRACLHAIDRNDLVNRLLTGNGVVGNPGWLAPSNPFYEPDVPQYPFDRVEAERLLDEAGYRRKAGGNRTNPDGTPLRYQLVMPDVVNVALAELVADSFKQVGLEIELKRVDLIATFGLKISSGYDLLITAYPGPAPVGPEMDPDLMRAVYHSKPIGNAGTLVKTAGYQNSEVDRLLEAQASTYDVAERKRLVSQVQKLVAADLPVAMLYYTKWYFVFRKSVFDQWYFTPGGFALGAPDAYNKHPYITGRKVGTEIREA
ncbi:MAG: ABC transporter substrate-binding protein [Acidimicrobiales bacterium]